MSIQSVNPWNGEILETKHLVIATGSKPRRLPFPGAELMITSDDVLSENALPGSVVLSAAA